MKFRLIPPGEFLRGASDSEVKELRELIPQNDSASLEIADSLQPQHRVVLTQPFYLGVTEVTQQEFTSIMGQYTAHFSAEGAGRDAVIGIETADFPADSVSWLQAVEFCDKLKERDRTQASDMSPGETPSLLRNGTYRLPTEAEWEFACRAGTTTNYSIGDSDLEAQRVAWVGANSNRRPHTVAELPGNPFGLHDLHGNLREWCQDWWEPHTYQRFTNQLVINPTGPDTGTERLLRGGFFEGSIAGGRSANHYHFDLNSHNPHFGFRVALTLDKAPQK